LQRRRRRRRRRSVVRGMNRKGREEERTSVLFFLSDKDEGMICLQYQQPMRSRIVWLFHSLVIPRPELVFSSPAGQDGGVIFPCLHSFPFSLSFPFFVTSPFLSTNNNNNTFSLHTYNITSYRTNIHSQHVHTRRIVIMSGYYNNRNSSAMGRAPNPAHNRQIPHIAQANGINGIYCYGCQQTKPRLAFSETQIKKAVSSTPKKTHQPLCKNCKSMHAYHSTNLRVHTSSVGLLSFQDRGTLKFHQQLNKDTRTNY
jgi:hypothetical protein